MWSKLQPTNRLSVFDYFVGLARKGLGVNATLIISGINNLTQELAIISSNVNSI